MSRISCRTKAGVVLLTGGLAATCLSVGVDRGMAFGFRGGGFGGFRGGGFGAFRGGGFGGFRDSAPRFGNGGFADRSTDAGFGQGGFGSFHNASSFNDRADDFSAKPSRIPA